MKEDKIFYLTVFGLGIFAIWYTYMLLNVEPACVEKVFQVKCEEAGMGNWVSLSSRSIPELYDYATIGNTYVIYCSEYNNGSNYIITKSEWWEECATNPV